MNAYPVMPAPKRPSNTPIYIALAALFVLAVITAVVVLRNDNSSGSSTGSGAASGSGAAPSSTVEQMGPRDVVVAFMKVAETGDSEAAKQYVAEPLASNMQDTTGISEGQSYEVGDETINGSSASVPVIFTINGDSATLTFKLSNTSGDWLITDVAL